MDVGLLKSLGQIAGIGGIALGVFFFLFRDLIRKSIFPKLNQADAYRLLRLISVLVWSVAVIGIGAWVWGDKKLSMQTTGSNSPIVKDVKGSVTISNTKDAAPK